MMDTANLLAEIVAEALRRPDRAGEIVREYFVEYFLLVDNVECLKNLLTNETWYLCLRRLYESTEYIEIFGFLVEADVAPSSSYTYSIDLTGTKYCCVCPVYSCSSDLGGYAKLTNLVNEAPTDVLTREWENKYAARNRPMPTDIGPSLKNAYDYVVFPKRKVKVTFTNTHPTETAHCIFYADYMQMELEDALNYMRNIYDVLTSYAKRMITRERPEWIRERYARREEIVERLKKLEPRR